jgi:hypothetical protein
MQISSDEEIKSKAFEIENLKTEVSTLHRAKEEALELQRRDLTNTFEQIIQKREDGFAVKEAEIAKQINLLDQKFERIQSENMKLKSDCREIKLLNEKLVSDIGAKDNNLRQLSYQVEDLTNAKDTVEDSLKRQVLTLQNEVKRLLELKAKERSELENEVDKVLYCTALHCTALPQLQ